MADGRIKVANHGPGYKMDPGGDRTLPEGTEQRFRAFLTEAIPALADAPLVGHRMCFYCDTFDGHFFVDRHPQRAGLTVAAGGSGHGFKFAPDLGPLIRARVEGRQHPVAHVVAWRALSELRFEEARRAD